MGPHKPKFGSVCQTSNFANSVHLIWKEVEWYHKFGDGRCEYFAISVSKSIHSRPFHSLLMQYDKDLVNGFNRDIPYEHRCFTSVLILWASHTIGLMATDFESIFSLLVWSGFCGFFLCYCGFIEIYNVFPFCAIDIKITLLNAAVSQHVVFMWLNYKVRNTLY